jgi:hypothetical protein
MVHFDLVTADGELWRAVIANEMDELNIKEAYLLTAEEYGLLKGKADAYDAMAGGGANQNG